MSLLLFILLQPRCRFRPSRDVATLNISTRPGFFQHSPELSCAVNFPAATGVSYDVLPAAKETVVTTHPMPPRRALILAASAIALILFAPRTACAQNDQNHSSNQSSNDNISVGFNLGKDASAKDVGLPLYPGSHRQKETDNVSPALNMGIWGGSAGFKIAILKMETADSPEKVAAFYRKALAKYGKVLTCPAPPASDANSSQKSDANNSQDKSSHALDCGTDKPDKGGTELKSGTKEKQHIVGITPDASGATTFQLVYVETTGLDDNK